MALTDLWKNSPDQLRDKHLQQIIAFAGSGKLKDGSATSNELRDFLSIVPSNLLKGYAEDCLSGSFPDSGLALQDVVNQVGTRLGYAVRDGLYRGRPGMIGFDGLWTSEQEHSIVVEVKTTDAYRIDLETVAGYRRKLAGQTEISPESSSILIVVGREDTGDLEAQIRGSRYAWDVRLISIDALIRLMLLKEEVDDRQIVKRISDMLIPREFTKLDEMIEFVFFTAEDVRKETVDEPPDIATAGTKTASKAEPKFVPVGFHDASIERVQRHLGLSLIKESRTLFVTPDRATAVLCAVSKQHERAAKPFYWFAFHPHQRDPLIAATSASVAFGCGSADKIVLIPYADFEPWLEGLNQTVNEDRRYWHIQIVEVDADKMMLGRKKGFDNIDLSQYLI